MPSRARLLNKNFVLLWQGQFVSQFGTQMFLMAMLLWLKEATGSATLVGLLMTLASLPGILLGPLGGTIADRYSRRNAIVATDLASGVVILLLAAVLAFTPSDGVFAVASLCVAAFLVGALGAVFQPAIVAAIPDLVPEGKVSSANSVLQASLQVAGLLAQGLSGVLFRILGPPILVLLNGLTYLFSGLSETFITIPSNAPGSGETGEEATRFGQQVREGLRYVWQRAGMRMVFVTAAAIRFFIVPFTVLLPFYVTDHLAASEDWFGFIVAGFGMGVMMGYLAAGLLKLSGKANSRLILVSMLAISLLLGSLGLTQDRWLALGLMVVAGVFEGLLSVKLVTVLQLTTPAGMRGRVFGLLRTVGEGLTPIALLLSGLVADLVGQDIPAIYLGCAVLLVVVGLGGAASGPMRTYLASAEETPGEGAAGAPEGEQGAPGPDAEP